MSKSIPACWHSAGAALLEEPADLPYGDRHRMVEDPCGNIWQIATHKGDASF